MELHLHNSATRRKERFEPLDPTHVRMYVCGPTVYDLAHLGNARPVVVFDVLARLLRRLYPRVTYARNITDVEDKIIDRARENGEGIDTLTARTTADYHRDMAALGNLPPDVEPRATGTIPEMIALIERLIANGHAYAAQGHVLFAVSSFADYGALSGRSPDELLAGARVEVAPYKRDAGDFVLWKPSTQEQPGWDSPWGRGRPGWHIECSAMSWKHLGPDFDIHGGGADLMFPHHENEVAQSVCAFPGSHFARFWMHNGMLLVNGEKMSKSLGNFLTVQDILKHGPWAGEAFRLLLLKTQYRMPLDYTQKSLLEAKENLDSWYRFLERTSLLQTKTTENSSFFAALVIRPLLDDLNTPASIDAIHTLVKRGNVLLAGQMVGNVETAMTELAEIRDALIQAADILGLLGNSPENWFAGANRISSHALKRWVRGQDFVFLDTLEEFRLGVDRYGRKFDRESLESRYALEVLLGNPPYSPGSQFRRLRRDDAEKKDAINRLNRAKALFSQKQRNSDFENNLLKKWVEEKIRLRTLARLEKNWVEADNIRKELTERGILLEDGPQGTTWRRA